MNFGNVPDKPGTGGDGDHGGFSAKTSKIDCCCCGEEHMKRDCPERAEKKKRTGKTPRTNAPR